MNLRSNLSPNYYTNRIGYNAAGVMVEGAPKIIVLHLTESEYTSAYGWLTNPASDASATRLFRKSGESVELVAETDAPWTNGFAKKQTVPPTNPWVLANCWQAKPRLNPNLFSLTAEIEWFESDGAIPEDSPLYLALVAQVADWCFRYDIPATKEYIMGHNEVSPAEKPFCGKHIPWEQFMWDVETVLRAKRLATDAAQQPSEWAKDAWTWAKEAGVNDGENPKVVVTEEQTMVFLHRFEAFLNDRMADATAQMIEAYRIRPVDVSVEYPAGLRLLKNVEFGKLIPKRETEPEKG